MAYQVISLERPVNPMALGAVLNNWEKEGWTLVCTETDLTHQDRIGDVEVQRYILHRPEES